MRLPFALPPASLSLPLSSTLRLATFFDDDDVDGWAEPVATTTAEVDMVWKSRERWVGREKGEFGGAGSDRLLLSTAAPRVLIASEGPRRFYSEPAPHAGSRPAKQRRQPAKCRLLQLAVDDDQQQQGTSQAPFVQESRRRVLLDRRGIARASRLLTRLAD